MEEKNKERAPSDLNRPATITELNPVPVPELLKDVNAHQTDSRFISIAAQKFVDENNDYLSALNEFPNKLHDHLQRIEPISNADIPIHNEVQMLSAEYDLLQNAGALSSSMINDRQRAQLDSLQIESLAVPIFPYEVSGSVLELALKNLTNWIEKNEVKSHYLKTAVSIRISQFVFVFNYKLDVYFNIYHYLLDRNPL